MTFVPLHQPQAKAGSLLKQTRELMPRRDLTLHEGRVVAEKQAHRFLAAAGVNDPTEIIEAIHGMPRVRIDRSFDLRSSGLSAWDGSHWQILVNGDDAGVRQRFTIAHELKHILDHQFMAHDHAYRPATARTVEETTEAVCDHFAGCLLMPRPWLKSAITSGIQDIASLARVFGVSRQAMKMRLDQTGLAATLPGVALPEALKRAGKNTSRGRTGSWYPRTVHFRTPNTAAVAA